MPVKIPVNLVPRAFVDYDMEQHQLLRHDYVLPDGCRIPPLTAARLMALELVCSEFFLHPQTCTQLDVAAALVLMTCRQSLVEEFTAKVSPHAGEAAGRGPAPSQSAARSARPTDGTPGTTKSNDTREAFADPSAARDVQQTVSVEAFASSPPGLRAYPNLAAAAASLLQAHGDAMVADYPRLVRWCIEVPFYGFDMIPKTGGGQPHECWFDGEFVGSVVAPVAKILATPVEFVLWETPLCLVWHTVAQHAAAYGVKNVERPPDEAVLKAMMKEAAEREARGELHPWQYADPITYNLTTAQFMANPALGPFFEGMRADFEKGGHKPLDPADYPIPTPVASRSVATITVEAPPPAERPESVEDAGTAFSTISVQDLSWSLPGSRAITVYQD